MSAARDAQIALRLAANGKGKAVGATPQHERDLVIALAAGRPPG